MPRIELRCTDAEKSLWVARAEERGLSLSEWVRGRLAADCVVGGPGVVTQYEPVASITLASVPVSKARFDPKCVNAQYHWRGSCKICGV